MPRRFDASGFSGGNTARVRKFTAFAVVALLGAAALACSLPFSLVPTVPAIPSLEVIGSLPAIGTMLPMGTLPAIGTMPPMGTMPGLATVMPGLPSLPAVGTLPAMPGLGTPAPQTTGSPRPTVPAAYAGKNNPLTGNAEAVKKGKESLGIYCLACHGEKGLGDGMAGALLSPKPSNLQQTVKEASDAYVYWRIAEGGAMDPFKSVMPAFKEILKEEQIWEIISYLKTLK